MSKTEKVLLSLATSLTILVLVFVSVYLIGKNPKIAEGSVAQGSEYHATTTAPSAPIVNSMPLVINSQGGGTFGSVIITGSGAGAITIYDATTTDITKRAAKYATSSIILASFPPSPTVGTYTFDEAYYTGLIYDTTGTQSTTTITYRTNN